MSSDLREQLQASLAGSYTVERELGGGGMSRVFVATETRLKRQVVVKVLHPDLAAGVNVERFEREIALAAALQHPCIVPVHTAGVVDGLPYYTMPFIQGESLRARLAAVGMLPVNEAVKVLRDVAGALAYAHERGIVHRDIKPDNVLLSGGYAVVTDFGIAKALSASKTVAPGGTITQLGTSVGTPAYMAPEQAAGDPNVDHRADIYSFGCMAYELLAGRTPFQGKTSHKSLAAQMSEAPPPILEQRPELPPALATLVMQCLEKDEAKRPQSANEVLQVLDATGTPSGGGHDVRPAIARSTRRSLARAIGIWAVAVVAVAVVAKAAVIAIGLPMWTFPGALVVMAAGLPVIVFTSFAKHGAHIARTMVGVTPGGSAPAQSTMTRLAVRVSPLLSWRRTWLGGAVALGVLVLAIAVYMVLRIAGIGPVGSLLARGVIGEKDKVLVTDFRCPASDSTLGTVISDALRTDLDQSRVVVVVQPVSLRPVLERMRRPYTARVDLALARDIAAREGIGAIVDGEVAALGGGFIVSLRLLSSQSGDVLAAYRETAKDPDALIPAVDRLSRQLRARIGESLRTVNSAPALERVSTASLEALRNYTEGARAFDFGDDQAKVIGLLTRAVALDSGFAMAYRKLGRAYENRRPDLAAAMYRKSYDLRSRLPEFEQHIVVATYFSSGPVYDRQSALTEWEAALTLDSTDIMSLNNVATLYDDERDHARARAANIRVLAVDSDAFSAYRDLAFEQRMLRDTIAAFATARLQERRAPGNWSDVFTRFLLFAAIDRFDSAGALLASPFCSPEVSISVRTQCGQFEGMLSAAHGQLRAARGAFAAAATSDKEQGNQEALVDVAVTDALIDATVLARYDAAVRTLDSLGRSSTVMNSPPLERRYLERATVYALARRADRAHALVDEWKRLVPPAERGRASDLFFVLGAITLAEGHANSAIELLRRANQGACEVCGLLELSRAYSLAKQPDSAIVALERYLSFPFPYRFYSDYARLALAYSRLGELLEARGSADEARKCYGKFVALWQHADPELQPQVARVKKRMAQLSAKKG